MPALIFMYHDVAETLESIAAGHRPYVLDPNVFCRHAQSIKGVQLRGSQVRSIVCVSKSAPAKAL